ncbi:hypothetical protein BASA50_005287 [Batrachochytrium salamandrivorans]|uniref:ATP synthase subunit e, mitochondrial n=1 Tax=Batrachochytrium salamandrivorans TaxID=1357716 RepID=A0ABQ8FD89_9FUNG|nr:hypothetical protein BASA60_009643 [Batrachochytrium salamandrivorans]KAH6577897.1 hypothetical protein BASA62_000604 [Batrachochytrium salamandrivorans]KAH6591212.1 hypothetical protein BASA61_005007 [Batrachochytrium salamandrivorans]KAH6596245.1 hypothetical protein BASA50_005287 [Batrachochytrium salamandrivorans]KAH9272119.1 hypothetical protein BASA83_005710 [Batrachochytrium salamandrivorans]
MSAASYPTLLGMKIYKTNFLKLYFPFFMSGSTAYFGIAYVHTKLSNAPDNKWVDIVQNVENANVQQTLRSDATEYLKKLHSGNH